MIVSLYLTLNLLPPLLIAGGVAWLGRRSGRLGLGAAGVCLALLVARPFLLHDPCLEHRLFPWRDYLLVHGWHFFLFPAVMVGLRDRVPRLRVRRALLGAAAAIYVLQVSQVIRVVQGQHLSLDARVTDDGFRLQTTGYSCAAASAANLLRLHGIEASETEMARASLLSRGRGMHDLGALRALEIKCAATDWRPVLRRLTRAELVATGRPALVPLRHSFLVNHMVCLLEARSGRFVLLDPAVGRRTLSTAEFDAVFLGRAVMLAPALSIIDGEERER